MITVVGAGCAYAGTEIDSDLLCAADRNLSAKEAHAKLDGQILYSCLPADYILQTGNADVMQALPVTLQSPTDLACQAAMQAISRAGITIKDIGLIIGDCLTPIETIPTEAQRLANRLGVKIPAYDLACGSLGLLYYLDYLQEIKISKLPDYILFFSSSNPTQRIDFSKGDERFYFSDCAGAIVVSLKHAGKIKFSGMQYVKADQPSLGCEINIFSHIKIKEAALKSNYKFVIDRLQEVIEEQKNAAQFLSPYWPTAWTPPSLQDNKVFQPVISAKSGFAFNAGGFCVLAQAWDSIANNARISLLITSSELMAGGLLMFTGNHQA